MKDRKDQILSLSRCAIDTIDDEIVRLIARRCAFVRRIGVFKAAKHLPPGDPAREEKILERLTWQFMRRGLDPELVVSVFKIIFQYSKRNHVRIAHVTRSK